MGVIKLASLVEQKLVNVNYGCPNCGDKPEKSSNPKKYFERTNEGSSRHFVGLKCNNCGHKFKAFVCSNCGRGYSCLASFSFTQVERGHAYAVYKCKCGKELKSKQGIHS